MEYLKNMIDNSLQFASSSQSSESSGSGGGEDSGNNNNDDTKKKDGSPPSIRSDSSPTASEEDDWNGSEEDWLIEDEEDEYTVELEVPKQFIRVLIDQYGNQPGADLSRLVGQEKTISLNADSAFEFFRRMYISTKNDCIPSRMAAKCDPFELSTDEDALNTWNTYLKNVKQEESDREFAMRLNDHQVVVNGKTASAFKDILETEKEKAALELKAYKELTSVKWTMAQNIKCSQLKSLFPALQPNLVQEVYVQNRFDYDKSLASLKDVYPSKFVDKPKDSPRARHRTESGNGWFYEPEVVAHMPKSEKSSYLEQARLWREEVIGYEDLFKKNKTEALEHQRSTHGSYNYKLAEASRYNNLMNDALDQFCYFNLLGLNGGNNNPNKIDLHGMRVSRAVEAVKKFLENRKAMINLSNGETCEVIIITGSGKHSLNNVARLYPAVKTYLTNKKYEYSEGYGDGSFAVRLMKMNAMN